MRVGRGTGDDARPIQVFCITRGWVEVGVTIRSFRVSSGKNVGGGMAGGDPCDRRASRTGDKFGGGRKHGARLTGESEGQTERICCRGARIEPGSCLAIGLRIPPPAMYAFRLFPTRDFQKLENAKPVARSPPIKSFPRNIFPQRVNFDADK